MKKEKKKPKYNKFKFILTFTITMSLLAAIRHGFALSIPLCAMQTAVAKEAQEEVQLREEVSEEVQQEVSEVVQEDVLEEVQEVIIDKVESDTLATPSSQKQNFGHKVMGVYSWSECFPDSQALQLEAAIKNGIKPCNDRKQVARLIKNHKLVNIYNSPFYDVADLSHSMPYLVPKAQQLLNTICYNFVDSLQAKGLPLHKLMVTSVLRTIDDVSHLQRGNKNATTNSCHCYGTTVDITYNRFVPLTGLYDPKHETTNWDLPMKQVLAEVLRDLREQKLCYVKYEKKQACFHLTVR